MQESTISSFIFGFATVMMNHYFPGITATVVIGSLAGATIFFVTTSGYTNAQKWGLALASFFIGIISAKETAALIDSQTPESVRPGSALGAIVASALAVHVILFIVNKLKSNTPIEPIEPFEKRSHDKEEDNDE